MVKCHRGTATGSQGLTLKRSSNLFCKIKSVLTWSPSAPHARLNKVSCRFILCSYSACVRRGTEAARHRCCRDFRDAGHRGRDIGFTQLSLLFPVHCMDGWALGPREPFGTNWFHPPSAIQPSARIRVRSKERDLWLLNPLCSYSSIWCHKIFLDIHTALGHVFPIKFSTFSHRGDSMIQAMGRKWTPSLNIQTLLHQPIRIVSTSAYPKLITGVS